MFNQDSKVAVLESKFSIYEDLTREMMAKLETAVDRYQKEIKELLLFLRSTMRE